MDNLTHSLVGAALGQAGLKRRTPLAMATLLIGANFPDIDVVAVPLGRGLELRRGWTHGVLALAVLPFVLTALVLAWDRWVRRRARSAPGRGVAGPEPGPEGGAAARPREVLLLAFLSILTHPTLDWMNTYGMRWLMPFRDAWYYGDALFIVDPWILLALGAAVWLSARRRAAGAREAAAARPARIALGAVAAYTLAMLLVGVAGRGAVLRAFAPRRLAPAAVMVAPVAWNPLVRDVVVRDGAAYRFGTLHVLPWRLELRRDALPTGAADPAARRAAASPEVRPFLHWARFPYFETEYRADGEYVRISDARYGAAGWATMTVRVARGP